MSTISTLRLGQLRQLRKLDPQTARAALSALANGLPALADETIRQGMQDALTRLARPAESTATQADPSPTLGPIVPPDCTPAESIAAMLGADIAAERQRQTAQRIAKPTAAEADKMYRLALGAGGGSGLQTYRWRFGR